MKNTKKNIHTVIKSRWLGHFIRLGYLIRGVLYGVIGIIAILVSLGLQRQTIGTQGAIQLIDHFYLGKVFLIIVALGLLSYSIWGFIRASLDFFDIQKTKIPFFRRIGYIISSISYGLLLIPTVHLVFQIPISQSSHGIHDFTFFLISFPKGFLILFGLGLSFLLGGAIQILQTIRAKNPEDFWSKDIKIHFRIPFLIFAKVGITMRGIVFMIVGYFICIASSHTNISEVKEFEGVLTEIYQINGGIIWLSIIGIGLLFFGIYSCLLGVWINLP